MINGHGINLSFGTQKVFDDISFTISKNQRVGLVGLNGSGKSTLLKAIAKQQELDSGTIAVPKNAKIAYMPQEVVLASNKSILQETMSAFAGIDDLQSELTQLEPQIQNSTANQKTIDRYVELHEQLAQLNPDNALAETKKVLIGLGFSQNQFTQPVASLSVGWKMRIILAKLLLQKADFYLFDEPTNHLDIVAKDWFINFLKKSNFGFMIVCHERYFLDQLCSHIFELERGNGTTFNGTYSKYEKQKEHNLELLKAAYIQQQKEIKRKQRTIARFRASATKARMAQSMSKQLKKIDLIELPPSPNNINFNFGDIPKAGRIVLKVKDVAQRFNIQIFKNVSFDIERGHKVAVVAPNGMGKTTLFNLIVGKLPLQEGSIELGYNVFPAIFDQDQNKELNLEKTIMENAYETRPEGSSLDVRTFLGSFLFSNDDVKKQVKVLSGGEKNRVGMVRTLLQQANLLLLDEPTNHLDIPSKELLLKALQDYHGTILFVSHDHDFINKLATHIIELTPDGAVKFEGDYDAFLYYKKHRTNSASSISSTNQITKQDKTQNNLLHKLRKKSHSLERKIKKIESKIALVENSFIDLSYGTDEFEAAQKKLQQLKDEYEIIFSEWEALQ